MVPVRTLYILTSLIVAQTTYARRKVIEDRLFELDGKKATGALQPFETAEYERFVRELSDLNNVKPEDLLAELNKDNTEAAASNLSTTVEVFESIKTLLGTEK